LALDTSATESRLRGLVPAIVGVAALLTFVAPVFSPGVQLYYRDTGRLYYPVKLYIAQALSHWRLPLWDPMTEAGVSLLGQVTPGLLHPATLLYLGLPFDFAFKLNALLGLVLGGIGAFRLARRLGASRWAALAAAVAYGGCGYLVSMTASNLPFALGAGTVPIAIDALLGFLDRGGALRFAWAAVALASIAYAGEPQSMLNAALIGGAWALLEGEGRAGRRGVARNAGWAAAWAAMALALSAPVALTAMAQLRRSSRAHGVSEQERYSFANHPARLLGLLVPRAFDDVPERVEDPAAPWGRGTFAEYFTDLGAAFSDSIALGAPALLFAACAAFCGRRGRLLLGGALLFALASTGASMGIDRVLFAIVPGAGFFRYAEKLIGPASLLFALACALGVDRALGSSRRAAVAAGIAAVALAMLLWIASLLARAPGLYEFLLTWGKSHDPKLAAIFVTELRRGLFEAAALSSTVALAALLRAVRPAQPFAVLGAVCCIGATFASVAGLLYTGPIEVARGPFELAEILESRAGKSPGRWRLFVNQTNPGRFKNMDPRLSVMLGLGQSLYPQYDSVAGIEGISSYFSAGDPDYVSAVTRNPEVAFSLFSVRFAVDAPLAFNERTARERNFHKIGFGYWVREYPIGPRAFLVGRAHAANNPDDVFRIVDVPRFDPRREAVVRGAAGATLPDGNPAVALPHPRMHRPAPERFILETGASVPALLVVGEHFDPGWRAKIDGRPANVLQVDLTALGVLVPAGAHVIELRFWPVGLTAGLWVLAAAAAIFAAATFIQELRRRQLLSHGQQSPP
jgi:hypothetical protein